MLILPAIPNTLLWFSRVLQIFIFALCWNYIVLRNNCQNVDDIHLTSENFITIFDPESLQAAGDLIRCNAIVNVIIYFFSLH